MLLVLDAIIVGMDMLIKKYGRTDKGKKRLCLITDALCPIKDPYDGTKEDQITTIAEQMTAYGMRMESIVVRGRSSRDVNKRIVDENDRLLNIFSKKTRARFVYVESPISLLGALRTRNITPVTIFRGDLELSSNMKIKVRFLTSWCVVKLDGKNMLLILVLAILLLWLLFPTCLHKFCNVVETLIIVRFGFTRKHLKRSSPL